MNNNPQAAIALLQHCKGHLDTLSTALEGRLSPKEAETLANLSQVQAELQSLLMPDADIHAQAMQYARDLVRTVRQRQEHSRRLEVTSQQLVQTEWLVRMGQIAGVIAHELSNILTPVMMYARIIYEITSEDDPAIADLAAKITESGTQAAELLRQLADAGRSDSALMIPLNLAEIIETTLTSLWPRFKEQGIKVERRYEPSLPPVKGSLALLEQVFINLILTALDRMPGGGNLAVTVTVAESFATVHLSDTGKGIPPEKIKHLLDPFARIEHSTEFGLFVSYLIVMQHHGHFNVESETGKGTTYTIHLPLWPPEDKGAGE